MNYIRGAVSAISAPYQYYKDINPSTLTGAIDVIVIRRPPSPTLSASSGSPDGDIYACSPFHVRFGKLQVLRPAEKKVNVSVNGSLIPFNMKIGDAGEAFFVFETDEDIPEDLVTSPLLSPTPGSRTPGSGAKPDGEGKQTDLSLQMQEPEFLDLNASSGLKHPIPMHAGAKPKLGSRSAPHTPPPEEPVAQPTDVTGPEVQYKADVALDMAGYHSAQARDATSSRVSHSQSPAPAAIPFPSTPPLVASPSSKHSPSLSTTTFPTRRAVSESLEDVPLPQYSWEWGAFPQPSPMTTHFPSPHLLRMGKVPVVDEHGPSEFDSDEFLARSRSVPLELEGSPHTIRSSLPSQDEAYEPDDEHEHELERDHLPLPIPEYGFGSGGVLTTLPSDSRMFLVHIEGQTLSFSLSLVPTSKRGIFHGSDEVEVVRLFEAGRIDYAQLVSDEVVIGEVRTRRVVEDEGLVIKWVGGQYITREDGSPLMDALRLWVENAPREPSRAMSEPPLSIAEEREPHIDHREDDRVSSVDEREPVSSGEMRRADSEPPESYRKPTSSSWVRWWSRSRDITEADRPPLRVSNTSPMESSLPKHVPLAAHRMEFPQSASAPPATPEGGKAQDITKPLSKALEAKIARTQKRYAKTLRLSSDQLKSLDLKPGANTITFSLSNSTVPACTARIFVWDSTDLVVVSDIDGTITKSDGLGHVFAMIGRDWTHSGVAKLYTDIRRNGYKIMYLTSRAIGQADSTRDYLKGIKQDDYQLPEGPVIMSPDRLMASLHREVIMRKPEVFKMACLRDIQRLFGESSRTPFYAGFGNRITDALSYRTVNVPSARIFTIDSSGEVKMELLELAGYKSSYIHMTDIVDQMFPPIHRKWTAEFTDFNYWKMPVQEFALPDLTPPSPALSARSDTSNQSTLARLRNFSLVGRRQSREMSQFSLPPPVMARDGTPSRTMGLRNTHLRQMSSLERLSGRLAALTQSSSSSGVDSRSSSSTFLDSDEEDAEIEEGSVRKGRPRSTSMTSMPGSLDDGQFGVHGEDEDEEGYEDDEEEEGGENEEEAAEEAFDEDFLATGEMKNVPFL
ncbi:Lipin/Ned1/Smp2-domain-containing protein [Suillus clintonianus]|uniref:Lipin/Ned1/Smp2-domain-containing protein n=1 Tax=Suillus clintonianus TaxID=1904413 RepID=UPI001B874CE4|nr:Lipin/Ned1/Smp2-domain-containing protein [Suillus clintonianus]KAG2145770.1 Lipin/Ned1/Smp2-domain-containing protein [Suillus clintonianus]